MYNNGAMRLLIMFLSTLLLCSCAYHPKIVTLPNVQEKLAQALNQETVQKLSVGEVLVYTIDWHGIPSGELVLTVNERTKIDGKDCYRVTATGRPYKFFTIFYNVRYEVETYIDARDFSFLKYSKKRIEGKNISEEVVTYDRQNNTVSWQVMGQPAKVMPAAPCMQNVLSFIYYFRTRCAVQGAECQMNVLHKGSIFPMILKTTNLEAVRLRKAGLRNAFVTEMNSQLTEDVAGSRTAVIYFSADDRRTPLIFKIKAKLGLLTGVLRNP